MNKKWNIWVTTMALGASTILGAGIAKAQSSQNGQSQTQQPTQQKTDQQQIPTNNSLSLDNTAPPANAEEDAAFKAFSEMPMKDMAEKIKAGEDFLQKYPQSRYRVAVYPTLVMAYLNTNQVPKMEETGEKDLELNPNDVQVLAVLGQTIPRAFDPKAPDAGKKLAKAEEYSKRAIEITPTIQKPANLSDDAFAAAKNQLLAMAHSGLGLVYFRNGKYADSIPELEQATRIDPQPDPVNYYLLGLSNKNTSHFEDAVTAFNKCAAIQSNLQAVCKNGAEEAKKASTTQLSAPK